MKLKISIFILLYLVFLYGTIRIFLADINYVAARENIRVGKADIALNHIEKAILYNKNEPRYFLELGKIYTAIAAGKDLNLTKKTKANAIAALEHARKLNPKNLLVLRNSIAVYYFLAFNDISTTADLSKVDKEYLKITKKYFQEVKSTYKNDLGVIVLIAPFEKNLGLEEEFDKSIQAIKLIRPDILEWYPPIRTIL